MTRDEIIFAACKCPTPQWNICENCGCCNDCCECYSCDMCSRKTDDFFDSPWGALICKKCSEELPETRHEMREVGFDYQMTYTFIDSKNHPKERCAIVHNANNYKEAKRKLKTRLAKTTKLTGEKFSLLKFKDIRRIK